MRDPERIPAILKELEKYWNDNPDLRLGQIISNFSQKAGYSDPFYFEDETLLKMLEAESKVKCE